MRFRLPIQLLSSSVKSVHYAYILLSYEKTRRERPKSAPYLRLKNIQGTTIGKIWKKKFFSKKKFDFFSKKSIF